MQYCPKCNVKIRGKKSCCPLCQGKLQEDREMQVVLEPPFPKISHKGMSGITFLKVCTFIFIALEIIFGTVDIMTGRQFSFIGVVMLGILVGWADILATMYFRNNLLKVITWEVFFAIVIDYYIDMKTGFHAWSINWMIPATLIALAVATNVIATVMKLRLDEYILYLVFDFFMALVQIIFIRNGMNTFPWPAAISVMIYMIMLAGLIIFRFRDLKNASEKMFNI